MDELKVLIETMSNQLKINTEETKKLTSEVHNSIEEAKQLKQAVEGLNKSLTNMEQRVSLVEKNFSKTSALLDNSSRRKNIILYNIPEEEEENVSLLEKKCLELFCKMDGRVDERDIDYVRRLGKMKGKRPVLVKFVALKKKLEILKLRSKLKNTDINLSEDYSYEVRTIRRELNQYRKEAISRSIPAYMKYDKLVVKGKVYTLEEAKSTLFKHSSPSRLERNLAGTNRRKKKREDISSPESESSEQSHQASKPGNSKKHKQTKKKNGSLMKWLATSGNAGDNDGDE